MNDSKRGNEWGPYELSTIAARVVREHEPRPMGCACGASMGDNIDYRWHLVNQAIAATAKEMQP